MQGPQWQSGNTLASHLWGRGLFPSTASSGKAGSCLPLVGSLQYRTLMNCMYWFPLPFQLPRCDIYDLYSVESDVKLQINKKINTFYLLSCIVLELFVQQMNKQTDIPVNTLPFLVRVIFNNIDINVEPYLISIWSPPCGFKPNAVGLTQY